MKTNAVCDEWTAMFDTAKFDSSDYLEAQSFPPLHKIILGLSSIDLEAQLQLSTAGIDDQDLDGRTALSWAAGKGDLAAVETLLEYGADPTICSRRRQTALTWAMHNTTENRYPVADALLKAGRGENWFDFNYRVPLIYAASMGNEPRVLGLLVDAGAEVNWRDNHKRTALGYAAKANLHENVRFLLKKCHADTSIADHWGYTPLIETVYQNHHASLQLLLDEDDVLPTHKAAEGMSVAHVAAVFADEHTLEILSRADASMLVPDDRNDEGLTPSELFCKREDVNEGLKGRFATFLDVIKSSQPEFRDAEWPL